MNESAINNKDLDDNMLDIVMYHDNLGTHLRYKDADYASWLLEGMDSTLKVVASKFDEHRKLEVPFEQSYNKLLVPSIDKIRVALGKNDFPNAIVAYQTLTKKCNGCHIDHNIDKEIFDWTDGNAH
jgi:hypothetical protein